MRPAAWTRCASSALSPGEPGGGVALRIKSRIADRRFDRRQAITPDVRVQVVRGAGYFRAIQVERDPGRTDGTGSGGDGRLTRGRARKRLVEVLAPCAHFFM